MGPRAGILAKAQKSICFSARQRGGSDAAIVGTGKPIVRFAKSQRAAGHVLVVEFEGRAQVENVRCKMYYTFFYNIHR